MLVLSRKKNQRVLFPNLNIAVEILRLDGNSVRVGIDAPKDVPIWRAELYEGDVTSSADDALAETRHKLRNQIHTATLTLHVLSKHLERGDTEKAQQLLDQSLTEFQEMDHVVGAVRDASPSCPTPTALIVEDNDHERELLAGYLRLCGYATRSAENGLVALSALANDPIPDVVLLDIHMPRMNGRQTVSAIRCDERLHDLKIFAISGQDPQHTDIKVGRGGVDRWFTKPLNPDEFAKELTSALDCPSIST